MSLNELVRSNARAQTYHDLLKGLSERPRRVPSKYFYDTRGSRLFEQISELEDYYLTACENDILQSQGAEIIAACGKLSSLNIVELGAGDGRKTCHLLRAAEKSVKKLTYRPVDISAAALKEVTSRVARECPGVNARATLLDMEHELDQLPLPYGERNLLLYLGSSLGNFTPLEQKLFLGKLRSRMNTGDLLLIGFDLKKDPQLLMRAYNDREGLTREFNLNLLRRFNQELGANFEVSQFQHHASYNPRTGAMESWLISLKDQLVRIAELDLNVKLEAFEGIHVETSWKFSPREIRNLAFMTGFTQVDSYVDARGFFVDELWSH